MIYKPSNTVYTYTHTKKMTDSSHLRLEVINNMKARSNISKYILTQH